MRGFVEVHNHISPEGRSREVNTGKEPVEKPPALPGAQLIRKTFSAIREGRSNDSENGACASKGSKGEVPEVSEK